VFEALRQFFSDMAEVSRDGVAHILRSLWLGIMALLATIFVMWLLNIMGYRGVNIPIALIGSLLVAMVGYRATNLLTFGGFGAIISALQDKDKSQGAATGLIWLTEILVALGLAFVLSAFTLMTWSFKQAPGAFWILFFAATLILLVQQHWKMQAGMAKWLIIGYAVLCSMVAIWTTFGGAYTGDSFNAATGEPEFMVDQKTGNLDSLNRSPADCRPVYKKNGKTYRYKHVTEAGVVFDYANRGTCFSAETGKRLVPMTPDSAISRNPVSAVAAGVATLSGSKPAVWVKEKTGVPWFVWVALVAVVGYLITRRRQSSSIPDRAIFAKTVIAILILAVAYLLYSVGSNIGGVKNWFGFGTTVAVEAVCGKYETVASLGHGNNKVGAINLVDRNPAKDLKKSRLVCVTATDKSFMLCSGNSAYNLRHEVVDATSGFGTDDFLKVGSPISPNCQFYEPKPNSFMLAGLKSVVVRFWLDVP